MKRFNLLLIVAMLLLVGIPAIAQDIDTTQSEEVYKVVPWISGGIAGVGLITNVIGLPKVKDKPRLTEAEAEALFSKEVSWLNRSALRQDPSRREQAHRISDYFMYSSAALPFVLFLDKKAKPHYWKLSLMYLETLSLTSNLYTYSPLGPTQINRYRPLAFYQELDFADRSDGNQRNSFYSGHVATTAVGTFFVAKVLADYHPEWGRRRILLYGAASIPPAVVAVLRVKALKHFPTDVVAGGVIGAGMGLLIPALHKKWQDKVSLSGAYSPDFKGGTLVLRF